MIKFLQGLANVAMIIFRHEGRGFALLFDVGVLFCRQEGRPYTVWTAGWRVRPRQPTPRQRE